MPTLIYLLIYSIFRLILNETLNLLVINQKN